jgi:hypothetical protein
VSDPRDALEQLDAGTRGRLEALASAVDRLAVDDLPLYVARVRQPRHRRAVEAAELVAIEGGLGPAVGAARTLMIEGVIRQMADRQFRVWVGGVAMAPDQGPVDQRVRIAESIGNAVTAIVLGDRLEADVRAELLGLWDRLLP